MTVSCTSGSQLTTDRIYNLSPITVKDDEAPEAVQKDLTIKWSLLWKSIIRSSLNSTAYPYCLYIRTLDLRNLTNLLEDTDFWQYGNETFFSADMSKYLDYQDSPAKKKIKTRGGKKKTVANRIDIPRLLDVVGESISSFVFDSAANHGYKTALEDITGQIGTTALQKWSGRLANLRSMTLYDGSVLDETVAESIFNQCPKFDDLTFFRCLPRDGVDRRLASFFSGLKSNSLRTFTALSANEVGPETLLALNHHSTSLKSLALDGLKSDAIQHLSLLQGCDQLESLDIHDAEGLINLEATENDIFTEVVEWLGRCEKLRELKVDSVLSAPAILTQVCLKNNIRLRSLVVNGYSLIANQDFHKAITQQTSLEELSLKADPEDAGRDDIECLVDSICCLKKLKELRLAPDTADYFQTGAIAKLASHLPNLEFFSFSGFDIGDEIWTPIASLRHLKTLNIFGLSDFTEPGILWYISHLQDSNRGLVLGIQAQNPIKALTTEELYDIEKALAAKVDGKLDYQLHRETDSSEEDFSD